MTPAAIDLTTPKTSRPQRGQLQH